MCVEWNSDKLQLPCCHCHVTSLLFTTHFTLPHGILMCSNTNMHTLEYRQRSSLYCLFMNTYYSFHLQYNREIGIFKCRDWQSTSCKGHAKGFCWDFVWKYFHSQYKSNWSANTESKCNKMLTCLLNCCIEVMAHSESCCII